MKYELIAFDVDGTLVGPDGIVPPQTAAAVGQAQRAGLRVCLATGRSYAETIDIWRQLHLDGPHEPMVLVGGAMVSEPLTGRTLHNRLIDRPLAVELADALAEEGYSAMALVDSWRHGVDYYLAESGDVHAAQREWFSKMCVRVQRVARLGDAADMPDPLRVSAVAARDAADGVAGRLSARFAGRLAIHPIVAPNYRVTVVEAHAAGVDKFAGVRYVAQALRIPPARIVAVGDDINDLAMVRGAGLGVVMPHAPRSLRAVADATAEPSLAAVIGRIVAGEFDGFHKHAAEGA